jgi:hypothetical protein
MDLLEYMKYTFISSFRVYSTVLFTPFDILKALCESQHLPLLFKNNSPSPALLPSENFRISQALVLTLLVPMAALHCQSPSPVKFVTTSRNKMPYSYMTKI